ncbi:hypothetical protein [Natronorubrum sp. FCH18a]|uniref:hypothetical protein n=1 Tax=Natronorubrum sp. FCH18a TaxID=3447018 RepID=UPI003F5114CF
MPREVPFGEPELLGYRVLVGLKEQSDRQISSAKFFKLCCIADRYLEDELGCDVDFPRYWYMYGEIAADQELGDFYISPGGYGPVQRQFIPDRELNASYWEDQTTFEEGDVTEPTLRKDIEEDDFDVDQETRSKINDAVRWAVHRFGTQPASELKEYQYQTHAPKEFIRAYSKLRWQLNNADLESQSKLRSYTDSGTPPAEPRNEDYVAHLLDEMQLTFPEEYEEMRSLYLRWDDTIRLMLEQNRDYEEIAQFLDSFIETLSQYTLRFEHGENIPNSRIAEWRDEGDDRVDEFEEELREIREGVLLNREESGILDSIAEPFDETVLDDLKEASQK